MKFADLSVEVLEKIRRLRYDEFIEKHEGPEKWEWALDYDPEFLEVAGQPVLLPIPRKNLANITILRAIFGEQGRCLTLFLKDTTHLLDPKFPMFAGRIALCEKMPGQEFFLTLVYHEWFASAPFTLDAQASMCT